MAMKLAHVLYVSLFGLSLCTVVACGSAPSPASPSDVSGTTGATTPPATPAAPGAKEGETCGDGTFGGPNVRCAEGLLCDTSAGTAPAAPPGASGSARGGVCRKAK